MFLIIVIILTGSVSLFAEEMLYKNSFQTDPIGLLFGGFGANYEHRFNPKHALFIEGAISNAAQAEGYMFSLHYRFYKPPEKDAKFLFIKSDNGLGFKGFFVRHSEMDVVMTIEEDIGDVDYNFTYDTITLGLHLGKTYLWDSGFTMTYRFGYGYQIGDFEWVGNEPEDAGLIEMFYKFFSGFDFGLTVGYCF